jgi:hypothetical protein
MTVIWSKTGRSTAQILVLYSFLVVGATALKSATVLLCPLGLGSGQTV